MASVKSSLTAGAFPPELQSLDGLKAENARLQAALTEAEGRNRLLEAELQRRLRNTLAALRSIIRRTALTSDTLEYYTTHLEDRFAAIGRGLVMAVRSGGAAGVGLDFLLAEELLAHGAKEGEQVALSGPPVELRGAAVPSLGLAFHELALNSVKYGALSHARGRIAITWKILEEHNGPKPAAGILRLEWVETGNSLDLSLQRRRGFGTDVIERALPYELDGAASLIFTPDGARCLIALPVRDEFIRIGHLPDQSSTLPDIT